MSKNLIDEISKLYSKKELQALVKDRKKQVTKAKQTKKQVVVRGKKPKDTGIVQEP